MACQHARSDYHNAAAPSISPGLEYLLPQHLGHHAQGVLLLHAKHAWFRVKYAQGTQWQPAWITDDNASIKPNIRVGGYEGVIHESGVRLCVTHDHELLLVARMRTKRHISGCFASA